MFLQHFNCNFIKSGTLKKASGGIRTRIHCVFGVTGNLCAMRRSRKTTGDAFNESEKQTCRRHNVSI